MKKIIIIIIMAATGGFPAVNLASAGVAEKRIHNKLSYLEVPAD